MAATPPHTYSPTCRLSIDPIPSAASSLHSADPPPLRAQFFYASRWPIDDPRYSGTSTSTDFFLPFSVFDNPRLEKEWLAYASRHHSPCAKAQKRDIGTPENGEQARPGIATSASDLQEQHLPGVTYARCNPAPKASATTSISRDVPEPSDAPNFQGAQGHDAASSIIGDPAISNPSLAHPARLSAQRMDESCTTETVGISRLHVVQFPSFEMRPVYWDPAADRSWTCRATWFLRETMQPLPTDLANALERGYRYMRPWTQTYADEIKSCLSIGAEAEERIVYQEINFADGRLAWNAEADGDATASGNNVSADSALAAGSLGDQYAREMTRVHSSNDLHVIFADGIHAQILRPSQLPSSSRSRRPLAAIRDGKTLGTVVVRGFDRVAWDKMHPSPEPSHVRRETKGPSRTQSKSVVSISRTDCAACVLREQGPRASDLVLVVHGIGQKFSERDERWRFTHAMTDLRRAATVVREDPNLQVWFRKSLGNIMVLPVNWRARFQPEGEKHSGSQSPASSDPTYTLQDVTPNTMPNIRAVINDVMLDIPYYMSDHKSAMVKAMVTEANTIYRLWCANNPSFRATGRVHIVAHSLGSVMALDALSDQPMPAPSPDVTDLSLSSVSEQHFEFDTTNFFVCGSPIGFFLYLNQARLRPRQEQVTTPSDNAINASSGEQGEFGCPAVHNFYNIIHPNDPISYRMNASVDSYYASHLRDAFVPPTSATWMQSLFQRKPPSLSLGASLPSTVSSGGRLSAPRLPSNVEMEVHQFDQEEEAERAFHQLNDNGQIDWLLKPRRNPIEIQYLSMLTAHSSYWQSPDFVRFLVLEIGRELGREHTIPLLRAVKTWT